MPGFTKYLLAILLASALSPFTGNALAEAEMEVSANRDNIYIGESLVLTIKVSGISPAPTPDLSAIRDCTVQFLGSRDDSHYSIVIVNGKTTRSGFSGRTFTYSITPQKTGSIQLGPISLPAAGRALKTSGPRVNVAGIDDQDEVIINVKASRDTVLVDESFEVTLNLFIKCLPGANADTERLLADQPPHISIPYIQPSQLDGLEHADNVALLQNWLVSRSGSSGFSINNYSLKNDPFDFENMFNFNEIHRERPAVFQLPREKVILNNTAYWRYHIETFYTAREERTHTFGPVLFKGSILDSISETGTALPRRVFAVGHAATVRVIPPPEEGRPPSFIGAIGTNMIVDASLDTQNCMVGDPLTLTIKVTGNINLRNIYTPDLTSQPALLRQFKVYQDTLSVERGDNSMSFKYTVRPLLEGSLELPPIDISYFDSASRAYRTIQTSPIPITTRRTEGLDADMILGTGTNLTRETEGSAGSSIRYYAPFVNHTPSDCAKAPPGLRPLHLALIAGAPLVFLISLAANPVRRVTMGLRRNSMQKAVYKSTIRQLKQASRMQTSAAHSMIASALRNYAGTRFAARPDSLTPVEIGRLASKAGLDPASASLMAKILERNFNASFSNSADPLVSAADDARHAAELVRKMESMKNPAGTGSRIIPVLILVLLPSAGLAGPDLTGETGFLMEKAWSSALKAEKQEDYIEASNAYRELAAAGFRNKDVFYNLGTALLLAGDAGGARQALERAERYGGFDSRVMQNLQAAAEDSEDGFQIMSWDRIIFFWHYMLPMMWRINIAITCWTALFLMLAFSRFRGTPVNLNMLIAVLILLAAFGTSAASSALQESQARVKDAYKIQDSPDISDGGSR